MEKAFKFRIYPNKKQENLIKKTFGCVRYVYNHFLKRKEDDIVNGIKGLNFKTMSRELTFLKAEHEWLREPDKCALQNTLKHLVSAYQRFDKIQKQTPGITKKKLKHLARIHKEPTRYDLNGHPKFKSKKNRNQSYVTSYTNGNIKFLKNGIQLPKLGVVRYRDKQTISGRILNATVSQEPSGKYYVSICCTDIECNHLKMTGHNIGIDLGLKDFTVTSDFEKKANPKYLRKSLEKLKRLQRALSRKKLGSKRREKNRLRLARLHDYITNQRNDFLQKYTTELVTRYDIICIEDLAVEDMEQNHDLAQSITDVSWSKFVLLLNYKTRWYGKKLIKVDRFYASSQLCSSCGYQNQEVRDLNIRRWICPECGATHDRDINASINILKEGLRISEIA